VKEPFFGHASPREVAIQANCRPTCSGSGRRRRERANGGKR
jgi:hypothetical protein